jgi:hypothetical protein
MPNMNTPTRGRVDPRKLSILVGEGLRMASEELDKDERDQELVKSQLGIQCALLTVLNEINMTLARIEDKLEPEGE